MLIASLNAWGGAMFDELVTWLDTLGADVVCVQEVTRTPGARGWTRFVDDERDLPQRADLFADLRTALPRHQALFVANDAGPVTDAQGRRRRQEFGIATFVAEDVPLIGVRSAFVHGEFTEHDAWPRSDRPRAALTVRVVDRDAGANVSVTQLHGLRDEAGKHDTPARLEQAERLAELVHEPVGAGDLAVLCGDLNLLPSSATFAVLGQLGLTDLVGTADTRGSRYTKPGRHASYLLVSDRSAVERFDIVAAPEVSDHRALLLRTRG